MRLTPVIAVQQQSPSKIGFPPVLISFTMSVFIPIADIAIMIKNLLIFFRKLNILSATARISESEGTNVLISVVITDARTK